MGKYALVVALNYVRNPQAALKGCVNDAHTSRDILKKKGFNGKNIKMVNDVDSGVIRPTGKNVKAALNWLCSNRTKEDIIFFHFSGHGVQIRDSSFSSDEADGKDEAIVLEDSFLLADDDLKQFFSMLPKGCQATVVMDCCHSGGLLDHNMVAISGDKRHDSRQASRSVSDPSEPRSLPIKILAKILSRKLGGKHVEPNRYGIAQGQAHAFGGDASKLAMQFMAMQLLGGGKPRGNPLSAILGASQGGGGGGMNAGQMAMIAGLAGQFLGGGGSSHARGAPSSDRFLSDLLQDLGMIGSEPASGGGAPPYRPTEAPMEADVGILITGCASDETSADVRPRNGKAHGALTNALYHSWAANRNATNQELVMAIRQFLQKKGTKQNPQLECSAACADLPFICGPGAVKKRLARRKNKSKK